jgi:hypothetical protein
MDFKKQILVICLFGAITISLTMAAFLLTGSGRNRTLPTPPPTTVATVSVSPEESTNYDSSSALSLGETSPVMDSMPVVGDDFTPKTTATPRVEATPGSALSSGPMVGTVVTPVPSTNPVLNKTISPAATPASWDKWPAVFSSSSTIRKILTAVGALPSGTSGPPKTPGPSPTPSPTLTPTPSPSPSPSPTPEDIFIIDVSHKGNGNGYAFGSTTDEVKRWQTFVANSYPYLTKVEVKIAKDGTTNFHSDVTVELYAVQKNLPSGIPLAYASIPAKNVTDHSSVVGVPLQYGGLTAGARYAVVLGQISPQPGHYLWAIDKAKEGLTSGKFNGISDWTDESQLGDGWLQVYVKKSPPGYAPAAPIEGAIIDVSHKVDGGYAFGVPVDENKRWQSFIANDYPNVVKVEVKIYKYMGTDQSDVTVELYATDSELPIGFPMATATIPGSLVGVGATVVGAPLTYKGLTAGAKYAIVLGQVTPKGQHYNWCTEEISGDLHFGKYDGNGNWVDESQIGDGWLQVYVTK